MDEQAKNLVAIHPATIKMGPIPFALYASSGDFKTVLFCRAGFPITERHKESLERADRTFLVPGAEIDAYHDYALERFADIATADSMPEEEKVELVRHIGRRHVKQLYTDPRSKEAMRHSGSFVEKYLGLILDSEVATSNLFQSGATASYSLTHSINVSTFCLLLGEQMFGDDRKKLLSLGLGGLLLDLGMCVLDRTTIERPAPLKKDDLALLHTHPLRTEELLIGHGLPNDVLAMGRSHHERFDGSGYPDGLRGKSIHPYARIAAVADVYDALTSPRGHREPLAPLDALTKMYGNRHLFDPEILKHLLRIVLQDDKLVSAFLRTGGIAHRPRLSAPAANDGKANG